MRTPTRLLLAALIVTAPALSARARLEMRARPSFAFAPSDVYMEFRIAPEPENRALAVSVDSGDFFRGSVIELEGERAPQALSVRYHGLPAGDYSLRGALLNDRDQEIAVVERQITVMATGGER